VVGKGQSPNSYSEFGDLAKHVRFAERNSRKLARSIFYLMNRWQAALEKKQARLGRIVDIGAQLFAMSSAVVYANTIANEHPERGEQAKELADVFCKQCRRRIDELFTALWFNDDEDNYELALGVLDGRYEWLEEGVVDPSGYGPLIAEQPDAVGETTERSDQQPVEQLAG
jgi:hypothetical protein